MDPNELYRQVARLSAMSMLINYTRCDGGKVCYNSLLLGLNILRSDTSQGFLPHYSYFAMQYLNRLFPIHITSHSHELARLNSGKSVGIQKLRISCTQLNHK